MSFSSSSVEILLLTFQLLEVRDLLKCRRLSRLFHHFIQANRHRLKSIHGTLTLRYGIENFICLSTLPKSGEEYVLQIAEVPSKKELRGRGKKKPPAPKPSAYRAVFSESDDCQHVLKTRFESVEEAVEYFLLHIVPNFNVSKAAFSLADSAFLQRALEQLPEIKSVNIFDTYIHPQFAKCDRFRGLRELSITDARIRCVDFGDEELLRGKFEILNIRMQTGVTPAGIREFVEEWKRGQRSALNHQFLLSDSRECSEILKECHMCSGGCTLDSPDGGQEHIFKNNDGTASLSLRVRAHFYVGIAIVRIGIRE